MPIHLKELTVLAASLTESVSPFLFLLFSGDEGLGLSVAMLDMESELGGLDRAGISRRFSKSWSRHMSDKVLAAAYILVGVWPDTTIFNI